MSDFIAELIDLDIDDSKEGIYAGSGSSPNPGQPETTPAYVDQKCWVNWKFTWTGHNNGGHSICNISAKHCGDHAGNTLVINIKTNFDIKDVRNASGYDISNVSLRYFTITRHNHFNSSDNISFNFEIETLHPIPRPGSTDSYHGAIGEENASTYYCELASYFCS